MEHKWQIGDEFKISQDKGLRYKCKFPNKTFIVDRISKSGKTIVYIDNRTNIKCKCLNCSQNFNLKWSDEHKSYINEKRPYKEVSVDLCILVRSKLQRNREIILNKLI
jgi:hypothetical protein